MFDLSYRLIPRGGQWWGRTSGPARPWSAAVEGDVMGGSSRYDREQPPLNADVAAEARAYSILAELLVDYRDKVIGDREIAMNMSNLLHSAAIELNNGRAIPIGIRRAVRGLAKALREAMDPNTRTS
jgi:hypothetical protein